MRRTNSTQTSIEYLHDAVANLYIMKLVVFELFRNGLSHIVEESKTIG